MTDVPIYRGSLPAALGLDFEFLRIIYGTGDATDGNAYAFRDAINELTYDSLRWKALDSAVEDLKRLASEDTDIAFVSGVNIIREYKDYISFNARDFNATLTITVEAIAYQRKNRNII